MLRSLDLYLWTEGDAAAFLGHLKAVIPDRRLDIRDAPSVSAVSSSANASPAEHRDLMSPVVQQLERTVTSPHFTPRAESTVSGHSMPGPPTPATSAGATASAPVSPPQGAPAPFAYNPAAPAAPEPIAYREKTPPPPDDGRGTGLTDAAKYDSVLQYAPVPQAGYQSSAQATPQQAYFPEQTQEAAPGYAGQPHGTPQQMVPSFTGQPQSTAPEVQRTYSGGMPPPPPGGPSPAHQQLEHAPSFGPPVAQGVQPTSPPPQQQSFQQNFNRQSTFNSGPPTAQYASYPSAPSFGPKAVASPGFGPTTPGYMTGIQPPTPSAPPAYNMHTPLQSPGLQSPGLPPPPPPPSQAPPPHSQAHAVHGYSQYDYSTAQPTHSVNAHGAYTGDIHNQVYRPTEAEGAHGHGHHAPKAAPAPPLVQRTDSMGQVKLRIEDKVSNYEKKVGGFLRRLDKLI
jgi:hypothetical protein